MAPGPNANQVLQVFTRGDKAEASLIHCLQNNSFIPYLLHENNFIQLFIPCIKYVIWMFMRHASTVYMICRVL